MPEKRTRKNKKHHMQKKLIFIVVLLLLMVDRYLASSDLEFSAKTETEGVSLDEIPEYEGEPYVVIDNNIPEFDEDDMTTQSFERYSDLDRLGRCHEAYANVSLDTMPVEERGNISSVIPSGWENEEYDFVDGGYVYNRCHLIGYQLSGENANEKNLITGTRYMNVQGMLPFENEVADYIWKTDHHVLLRVTPIYDGNSLVANGVQMEAKSVEDDGEGVQFNVYCYNVQPGVEIDYATGENHEEK
ncbi:MAG: DNA/RNA non-specific endonuclease [Lachnospiraceae bacterium]